MACGDECRCSGACGSGTSGWATPGGSVLVVMPPDTRPPQGRKDPLPPAPPLAPLLPAQVEDDDVPPPERRSDGPTVAPPGAPPPGPPQGGGGGGGGDKPKCPCVCTCRCVSADRVTPWSWDPPRIHREEIVRGPPPPERRPRTEDENRELREIAGGGLGPASLPMDEGPSRPSPGSPQDAVEPGGSGAPAWSAPDVPATGTEIPLPLKAAPSIPPLPGLPTWPPPLLDTWPPPPPGGLVLPPAPPLPSDGDDVYRFGPEQRRQKDRRSHRTGPAGELAPGPDESANDFGPLWRPGGAPPPWVPPSPGGVSDPSSAAARASTLPSGAAAGAAVRLLDPPIAPAGALPLARPSLSMPVPPALRSAGALEPLFPGSRSPISSSASARFTAHAGEAAGATRETLGRFVMPDVGASSGGSDTRRGSAPAGPPQQAAGSVGGGAARHALALPADGPSRDQAPEFHGSARRVRSPLATELDAGASSSPRAVQRPPSTPRPAGPPRPAVERPPRTPRAGAPPGGGGRGGGLRALGAAMLTVGRESDRLARTHDLALTRDSLSDRIGKVDGIAAKRDSAEGVAAAARAEASRLERELESTTDVELAERLVHEIGSLHTDAAAADRAAADADVALAALELSGTDSPELSKLVDDLLDTVPPALASEVRDIESARTTLDAVDRELASLGDADDTAARLAAAKRVAAEEQKRLAEALGFSADDLKELENPDSDLSRLVEQERRRQERAQEAKAERAKRRRARLRHGEQREKIDLVRTSSRYAGGRVRQGSAALTRLRDNQRSRQNVRRGKKAGRRASELARDARRAARRAKRLAQYGSGEAVDGAVKEATALADLAHRAADAVDAHVLAAEEATRTHESPKAREALVGIAEGAAAMADAGVSLAQTAHEAGLEVPEGASPTDLIRLLVLHGTIDVDDEAFDEYAEAKARMDAAQDALDAGIMDGSVSLEDTTFPLCPRENVKPKRPPCPCRPACTPPQVERRSYGPSKRAGCGSKALPPGAKGKGMQDPESGADSERGERDGRTSDAPREVEDTGPVVTPESLPQAPDGTPPRGGGEEPGLGGSAGGTGAPVTTEATEPGIGLTSADAGDEAVPTPPVRPEVSIASFPVHGVSPHDFAAGDEEPVDDSLTPELERELERLREAAEGTGMSGEVLEDFVAVAELSLSMRELAREKVTRLEALIELGDSRGVVTATVRNGVMRQLHMARVVARALDLSTRLPVGLASMSDLANVVLDAAQYDDVEGRRSDNIAPSQTLLARVLELPGIRKTADAMNPTLLGNARRGRVRSPTSAWNLVPLVGPMISQTGDFVRLERDKSRADARLDALLGDRGSARELWDNAAARIEASDLANAGEDVERAFTAPFEGMTPAQVRATVGAGAVLAIGMILAPPLIGVVAKAGLGKVGATIAVEGALGGATSLTHQALRTEFWSGDEEFDFGQVLSETLTGGGAAALTFGGARLGRPALRALAKGLRGSAGRVRRSAGALRAQARKVRSSGGPDQQARATWKDIKERFGVGYTDPGDLVRPDVRFSKHTFNPKRPTLGRTSFKDGSISIARGLGDEGTTVILRHEWRHSQQLWKRARRIQSMLYKRTATYRFFLERDAHGFAVMSAEAGSKYAWHVTRSSLLNPLRSIETAGGILGLGYGGVELLDSIRTQDSYR